MDLGVNQEDLGLHSPDRDANNIEKLHYVSKVSAECVCVCAEAKRPQNIWVFRMLGGSPAENGRFFKHFGLVMHTHINDRERDFDFELQLVSRF